ncbi:STAS domain-containing protein [Micromonospora sp. CPCC 206060]|uniref:STAS domain-containing protein n=1 Tax=Micromonospora sp. CPCC 206060 TaxID=3122406 RepID=UPI002FEF4283
MDQGGAEPVFSATAEVDDGRLMVRVRGEVDMSTAETMYQTAVREPAEHLMLDLRRVTFFDSAAIHAVIRIARHFPDSLTVLPSPPVRRVLEIAGLIGQPWLSRD